MTARTRWDWWQVGPLGRKQDAWDEHGTPVTPVTPATRELQWDAVLPVRALSRPEKSAPSLQSVRSHLPGRPRSQPSQGTAEQAAGIWLKNSHSERTDKDGKANK